jgi:hypothetical protein
MTERYVFPVRYDEKLMRSAVNSFMTRVLFQENPVRTFLPLALIALSCAMLFFSGEQELGVELFIAALVVLVIFVASGWRMHLRTMRKKVDAMKGRWPMARLHDDGLIIDGPGPASLLEWPDVKAIWPIEGAWLLILATNHFVMLPLAGAPREALEFLRAHVRPPA